MYVVFAVLITSMIAGGAPGTDRYVIPLSNNTAVFANNPKAALESPSFTVGTADRLLVVETSDNAYKVSDLKGNVGWVEKKLVKVTGASESLVFGGADVQGYLDNPVPIYILDANNPGAKPVTLTRSFSEEMKENKDRMTFERTVSQDPR